MTDKDDTPEAIAEKKALEARAINAGLDGLDRRKSLKDLRKIVKDAEKKVVDARSVEEPKVEINTEYKIKEGLTIATKGGIIEGPASITADKLEGGKETFDLFVSKGFIVKND